MNKTMKKLASAAMVVSLILVVGLLASAQGRVTIRFRFRINGISQPLPLFVGGPGVVNPLPFQTPMTLPPFPGIDPSDFNPVPGAGMGAPGMFQTMAIGSTVAPPAISPSGQVNIWLGASFPLTISNIDTFNWTQVQVAEFMPAGFWRLYNVSGFHPAGRMTLNFIGDSRGTHIVMVWADNNHNGWVDNGELALPALAVNVR